MRRIFLIGLVTLFLGFSTTCYAGEWKKKPFKNVYGQDKWVYTETENGYKGTMSKKPFKNIYGQDEYQYRDNQGNRKIIRQKPFPDIFGNPVYEDVDE